MMGVFGVCADVLLLLGRTCGSWGRFAGLDITHGAQVQGLAIFCSTVLQAHCFRVFGLCTETHVTCCNLVSI